MDRTVSRRAALGTLGSVGLGALLAACTRDGGSGAATTADVPTADGATATVSPQTSTSTATADLFEDAGTCTVTPELTEGPYYVDVDSIRSDIREDRDGTALRLAVRVQDDATCDPVSNAVVDVWHCDAGGLYSGFESASQGGAGGGAPGGGNETTDEKTYLRGAQVTNAAGVVEFLTVYPGWYRGRTVHIHAKVHLDRSTVLTSQFFFPDDVTEAVYAQTPYSAHTGRETFNDTDRIFDERLVLGMRRDRDGDGYVGAITLAVRSG